MSWKIHYRYEVREVGGSGALLAAFGYSTDAVQATGVGGESTITSLDSAVSSAAAFNRRMQSNGLDSNFKVFGKPLGSDVTGAVIPLAGATIGGHVYGDATVEQEYVTGDTPEKGLMQRMGAANRSATGLVNISDDFLEDPTGTEGA